MAAGQFGRRVYHIGPERDLVFFLDAAGRPFDIERVPLEEAEGIVCTGLFDDRTETPDGLPGDHPLRQDQGAEAALRQPGHRGGRGRSAHLLRRRHRAAYAEAGGRSYYFGKPHPPIYALARRELAARLGYDTPADEILCLGDGIGTDILGAMGEGLDSVFVTGGLAAEETGTTAAAGPDPALLAVFLDEARMSPRMAMAFLR